MSAVASITIIIILIRLRLLRLVITINNNNIGSADVVGGSIITIRSVILNILPRHANQAEYSTLVIKVYVAVRTIVRTPNVL